MNLPVQFIRDTIEAQAIKNNTLTIKNTDREQNNNIINLVQKKS